MQEFHILWFEDNYEKDFKSTVENLTEHLKNHNRKLIIHPYGHYPADFDVKMFEGKYSIAFMDLNLNEGQKSTEIVKIIRKTGAYIDILMYSNNPKQLIDATEGRNYVENVFRHATYTGLEDKMKGIIDQVLYKETMAIERERVYKAL